MSLENEFKGTEHSIIDEFLAIGTHVKSSRRTATRSQRRGRESSDLKYSRKPNSWRTAAVPDG